MSAAGDHIHEIFVVHEHRRYRAYLDICSALGEFHTRQQEHIWPTEVLPYIADATFSDGAAYIIAEPKGALTILSLPAGERGNEVSIESLPQQGEVWQMCMGTTGLRILNSHMNRDDICRLGLRLPEQSSVMAERIGNRHACICVWRHKEGGREHSADSYEVYDMPALQLANQMTALTMDVVDYFNEVIRLGSIRKAMQTTLEIVMPKLAGLHALAMLADDDIRTRLTKSLTTFDEALRELYEQQVCQ